MREALWIITEHAIDRYQQRVRPDLDRDAAADTLAAEIEALDGLTIARARRERDLHVRLGESVLVVNFGRVVTVLTPNTGPAMLRCEYCHWAGTHKKLLEHVMRSHLMRQEAAE